MDNDIIQTIDGIDNYLLSESITCNPEDCLKHITNSKKQFKIMTQNIRSICCNFSGFRTLLHRTQLDPDVLVLTECWLNSPTNSILPHMDYYTCISSKNNLIQNDGVVVYVKSDITSQSYEPTFSDANCLVTILNNNVALISIYRSPSYKSIEKFIQSLDNVLSSLQNYKTILVTGDINLDIIPNNIDDRASTYLELLACHGLLPAHVIPTRDKTCLDHAMIKSRLNSKTLIIDNSLTDHNGTVFISIDLTHYNPLSKTMVSKVDYQGISNDILKTDLGHVMKCTDCEEATNMLINSISTIINNNTTVINLTRRKTPLKPWITEGLLRCIRTRDRMHKKLRLNPDNINLSISYRRYRNFCNALLKKLKLQHEKSILEMASNTNVKKTWQVINEITRFKPNKSAPKDLLLITKDPIEAVNAANDYFAHVGENLAKDLPPFNNAKFTEDHSPNSFVLLETDLSEVITLINSLKNTASSGNDNISSKILKQNIPSLAAPLTHICNLAISTGIFPQVLKQSVITPIHKDGDKATLSNYRPISILPTISKILEKILNNQLIQYLEKNNLLSPNQFGFRRGKSTADAVSQLTEKIARGLDEKDRCLAVFLDLRKAFDTISIPILIEKLENIGVRSLQLQLFKSYLSDRTQTVKVSDKISEPLPVKYGVPQGSILGPTLFLIYINGLCNLNIKNSYISSFADDTAVLFRGSTWDLVFNDAQDGLNVITKWLGLNRLSLNIEKTKYMTFSMVSTTQPKNSIFSLTAHSLLCSTNAVIPSLCNCNSQKLEKVIKIKYLGVILDEGLTFREHINVLSSRIRKLIGIFKNIRFAATPKVMKTIYFALCQSLLLYCIGVWGGAAKTHLIKIERAQRAVLKVIHFLPRLTPTLVVYQKSEVLTVRQLFIQHSVLLQHRRVNTSNTNRDRRRKDIVSITERCRTTFAQRFQYFLCKLLYNRLNGVLDIFDTPYQECSRSIRNYLLKLSYIETEELLTITT